MIVEAIHERESPEIFTSKENIGDNDARWNRGESITATDETGGIKFIPSSMLPQLLYAMVARRY